MNNQKSNAERLLEEQSDLLKVLIREVRTIKSAVLSIALTVWIVFFTIGTIAILFSVLL